MTDEELVHYWKDPGAYDDPAVQQAIAETNQADTEGTRRSEMLPRPHPLPLSRDARIRNDEVDQALLLL